MFARRLTKLPKESYALSEGHNRRPDIVLFVNGYEASDIPDSIKGKKEYHPFFRNLKSALSAHSVPPDRLCEMAKATYELIDRHKIVDWHRNIEVERRARMELEDYLFDVVKKEYRIPLATDEIDNVINDPPFADKAAEILLGML